MHVYAFTPTYANALRPETVASVIAQRWGGRLTWQIGRHNPYPAPDMRNVGAQYDKARSTFLAGDYDALWLVEHDMVLPPDALAKLVDTDAQVVYAPYMLRHGTNVLSAWRYEGDKALGESLSLHRADLKRAKLQPVTRVSGVGFGCTLLRREVVVQIPFRVTDAAPDTPFATDCLAAGIVAVARWDAACGHIHEGAILATEPATEGVTVTALQNVTVNDEGTKVLVKGQTYTLSLSVAKDLARAGQVEIVKPEPAKPKAKK